MFVQDDQPKIHRWYIADHAVLKVERKEKKITWRYIIDYPCDHKTIPKIYTKILF